MRAMRSVFLVVCLLPAGCGDDPVIINGRELGASQLEELKQRYGQPPLPGTWWYDPASGMYGAAGGPAAGFMLPGHDLGPLSEDASGGDTGIFVNGRELEQQEWIAWSALFGGILQPGRYWLDGAANYGVEGYPLPLGNLLTLIAARSGGVGPGGGGADNLWSTRFSAGNFDSGNTRGYVSVPGVGPVGYGF